MIPPKTYLKVPYAEKDAAKALGAKWDALEKKWFVPDSLDLSIFAKWLDGSNLTSKKINTESSVDNKSLGVFTYPSIQNFVAYDGEEAPWD